MYAIIVGFTCFVIDMRSGEEAWRELIGRTARVGDEQLRTR
jgi:hypothetical protein